jgi:ATP phosphoribosyltransferase regulatory subunit
MSRISSPSADIEALDAQSRAIGAVFSARGYRRVSPPILQPADVSLDLMGETIRAKTYIAAGQAGPDLCVRPDLTLAVCRMFLQTRPLPKGETRLSYDGPVFRLPGNPADPPHEWRHAGIECLNGADREKADAEVLGACLAAIAASRLSREAILVEFNDLELFAALAAVIELPDQWRARLVRHFLQPEKFKRLMMQLSGGAPRRPADHANLLATLSGLAEADARALIADVLRLADFQTVGGRTVEEITERMLGQAADLSLSSKPQTVALIESFLTVSGPPRAAIAKIEALAKKARLPLDPALERFTRRLDLFEAETVDLKRLRFGTEFGRSIGYYTGLIFAIRSGAQNRSTRRNLGSGGRYDGLLAALGAAKPMPAIGATVFCHDLLSERLGA